MIENNNHKNITLEELARMTAKGFASIQENMATKEDLANLRNETKKDLANLRNEIDIMLDRHIGTFRKDYDELAYRVKKLEDPKREIGAEICDLMFALVCLANSHDIDLDKTWKETISARFKRDENRYK